MSRRLAARRAAAVGVLSLAFALTAIPSAAVQDGAKSISDRPHGPEPETNTVPMSRDLPPADQPSPESDPGGGVEWNPGDPFDDWAWLKINKLRDANTGVEEPASGMPPNENQLVNVSVVNKCPGPAPNCDPQTDIITFAVLNLTVWYPTDPLRPVHGEVPMSSKNLTTNRNEWWGEIGGGGAGGKVWPLPKCARVHWVVKIWDVANRAINSSNSVAAGTPILPQFPNGIANYTVEGNCVWPPGCLFPQCVGVDQAPLSATNGGPGDPIEAKPGGKMPAGQPVKVRVLSRLYVQMPWIMLYVDQSTVSGDFNQSWLVGVRGYCYDFSVSPGVCDVSNGGSPSLPRRNGTEFVFDLPGFYAGSYIEYSIVAVDYTVWDYRRDPDYLREPWDYLASRVYCEKKPSACLQSPNYYYHVPSLPPVNRTFIGRLSAQLLTEVHAPSGKKLGLDYVADGCARFENDTWRSQTLRTNEYGLVTSPIIQVNASVVVENGTEVLVPTEFRVVATWPCLTENIRLETKFIPNNDGPNFQVNATWFIVYSAPSQSTPEETVVGWHGMDWAYVYGIGMIGFSGPTLFLALRWFSRRKHAEDEKRAEAEARFKV